MLNKLASKAFALTVLFTLSVVIALSACQGQSNAGIDEPVYDDLYEETNDEPEDTAEVPFVGDLSGKWYKNGDTSDEYYELTDSTYNRITADGYEYGEDSYSISGSGEWFPVGEQIDSTAIAFGDSMIADRGYFSPGFELFAVTELGGSKAFYVRDSVIGTAEGDAAIARYIVITSDWQSTDDSCAFRFYSNNAFEYLTRVDYEDGMYSFETSDTGNWDIEADILTINWSDGTEEVCDLNGNTFYVSSLDATLFNGKADRGVLIKWYGDYAGVKGEVAIYDTLIENAINISFYLNDDIGSMYSNSGMELRPDGSSAADGYLEIYLDGDTLTVKALNPGFDNYEGTYERLKTAEQTNGNEVDKEEALNLLSDELSTRGVDTEALGLELYYDEPESVLSTLDFDDDTGPIYVDAWIFLGEDTLFYAVVVGNGRTYQYDMVNGALIGIDETVGEY